LRSFCYVDGWSSFLSVFDRDPLMRSCARRLCLPHASIRCQSCLRHRSQLSRAHLAPRGPARCRKHYKYHWPRSSSAPAFGSSLPRPRISSWMSLSNEVPVSLVEKPWAAVESKTAKHAMALPKPCCGKATEGASQ